MKKVLAIIFFIMFQFVFTQAQVFIPLSFWSLKSPTLVISDGATFNYGTIATLTNVDKIFTVTNTGGAEAFTINSAAWAGTRYSFKGGSYPGTGGNCGTNLLPADICNIVVTAYSTTTGTFNDAITLNYTNGARSFQAARAVTATFTSTPTRIGWINTPTFIKVNDCIPVTVQAQDNSGNLINVGANTTVTLAINNATNSNFYTTNTCATTTTSRVIATGTNSITFYFKSTTGNQSGIFIGSSTGLIAATQNVNITNAPSKLLLIAAPRMKINTCNSLTIYTVDSSGYYTNVAANVTVNMTTTGANIFYSDAGCSSVITSTIVASGTSSKVIYTQDATLQTVTSTATDAAAALTASNESITFASSLTWWNTSFTKRIRIDINNLDQATAFTNQPVLVSFNSSNINYSDFETNGADVRFVAADDSTQLNHEIEFWSTAGTSQIWVRIPSIAASSSAGYFYMYYKNPGVSDGQNKTGVWTNYWAVWHLNENPTGTAPQYLDSTVNARNGTQRNNPTRTTGVIGYAADLSGANDAIQINQDLSPVIGVTSTFSCWMKTTQTGNDTPWAAPAITGVEQSGGGNDIFFGYLTAGGAIGIAAGNGAGATSSFVINNNAWRHITMTRDSATGNATFYVNGVANGSGASESGNKTTFFDLLGEKGNTGGAAYNYNGQLDEVRVFSSVQSAAQIKADFKFMMNTNLIYNTTESWP